VDIHSFGLFWDLNYKLYFLKEHSEGAFRIRATERIQHYFHEYVNGWNATLRYKTTESASEVGNGKTVLETYKLYILTNDTEFTEVLERFIYVDVINELHYLTVCFNAFKLI
jgi:hypothetical protein